MAKLSFSKRAVRGKLAPVFWFRFVKKLIGHAWVKIVHFEQVTACDSFFVAHETSYTFAKLGHIFGFNGFYIG